ncbi:hypothetical protein ACF91D_29800 [Staphylococcus sp. 231237_7MaSpsaltlick]|uniref:hypothetical protein n=1 Tax=Staphylococcus TaxID=1279 RepID=UPI00370B70A8
MKSALIVILKLFSFIAGIYLIMNQSNKFVSEAATGETKPFYYLFIIIILIAICFILIPLIIDLFLKNKFKKPLFLRLIIQFINTHRNSKSSQQHIEKSINGNQQNMDDRICQYFNFNYSIEDVYNHRTALGYEVAELTYSIENIMDEVPNLINKLIKYKHSDTRNEMADLKIRDHKVTIEYLNKYNIKITSGVVNINVPLYKCKQLHDFDILIPYLKNYYLKPQKYTI